MNNHKIHITYIEICHNIVYVIFGGRIHLNVLYIVFFISLILLIVFFFTKKKLPCFICSLISTGILFVEGVIHNDWFGILWWSAVFLMDLYEYKKNSWDFWGHFDV